MGGANGDLRVILKGGLSIMSFLSSLELLGSRCLALAPLPWPSIPGQNHISVQLIADGDRAGTPYYTLSQLCPTEVVATFLCPFLLLTPQDGQISTKQPRAKNSELQSQMPCPQSHSWVYSLVPDNALFCCP